MEFSDLIERFRVNNVFLCEGPRQPQIGSLSITSHHLIFSPAKTSSILKNNLNIQEQELWLLHRAIDRVLVEPFSKNLSIKQNAYLRLKCKNFMTCCIEMEDLEDCQAVARSIEKLSNLSGIEHDYPFYYRCPFKLLENGWETFNIEDQFKQLLVKSSKRWRISSVNKSFKVCLTYPETVIVPKGIGDDYLKISATFREGGRFPILCYYHTETKSCIMRCSQPLLGPTNRRCKEDETILNSLLTGSSRGIIFETRTKANALASKAKGGGFETQMYYCRWKYVYGNIPHIKNLHNSLSRLTELCTHEGFSMSGFFNSSFSSNSLSSDRWLNKLTSCGWLQNVTDLMTGAATVAQCVHCKGSNNGKCFEEVTVVVHGGEGFDLTLAVTSLAQICLDSSTRTIKGFQSLIEREWINAGHPFALRCAHFAYATGTLTGPHESPVFLCFLDCTWQLMRQYPCNFEFNEDFLILLFEHAYASEFGSFLGNCEAEKKIFFVKEKTISLWSYVNHPEVLSTFVNAIYEPYTGVLWPSVAPQSIILWERMYMRWQQNWSDFDNLKIQLCNMKCQEKHLQSQLKIKLQEKT